jgi:hypothetical protein
MKMTRKTIFLLKIASAVKFRLSLPMAAKYPDRQAFFGA